MQQPAHQSTATQQSNIASTATQDMTAFGADAYHSETRKVSSVVIESKVLGEQPDTKDRVRYVEVPTIEEQVTYKTVHEKREVEKRVPKYEIEYVDRVVEVPKTVYIDVPNEEKKYVERRIEKKVPYNVERMREVIREVKVPRPRYVEKIREVPGDVIEKPKYVDMPHYVEVVRNVDREVPVIVAQTIKPIITESETTHEVDVFDYEPEVMPVDVHIAKPVASTLEVVGQRELKHRLVNVTSAQYNTVLRMLNANASEKTKQSLPFVFDGGKVPFVPEHEAHFIVAPPDVQVEGWTRPMQQQNFSVQQQQQTYSVQQREVASLGSRPMLASQQANEAACCRDNKKKMMMQQQQQQQEELSSHHHHHHHVPSASPPSDLQSTNFPPHHLSQHHRPRDWASQQASAEEVTALKDGSTIVLSHRPHAKSRVCC